MSLGFLPTAKALEMQGLPLSSGQSAFTARSYLVIDKATGEVLVSSNADLNWVPASLTKLVTVLVVLDTKPNLTKSIAMSKADEVGGARIATVAGVKYKTGDLLHATLIASANNAANALARSTGLSREEFVERMNKKALELGATQSVFYEPTGIDERNITSAEDYAKIARTAFSNQQILKIAKLQTYSFRSTSHTKYVHTIKNTNKLLGDSDMQIVAGKTGYLVESRYNFVSDVKDRFGNEFIVVLMGSQNSTTQFRETKELAFLAALTKAFAVHSSPVKASQVETTLSLAHIINVD